MLKTARKIGTKSFLQRLLRKKARPSQFSRKAAWHSVKIKICVVWGKTMKPAGFPLIWALPYHFQRAGITEHKPWAEVEARCAYLPTKQHYGQLRCDLQRTQAHPCLHYLQNRQDAGEEAQDVFVKTHAKLGGFEGWSSPKTWVYRIAASHFTSNQAARDLRPAKVRQKVAGCFRTLNGAQTYARIIGFISTARKHQRNVFKELLAVFNGYSFLAAPEGC